MLLTIGLVILVIFLFLRTLWATIIPSLAVPLSLLATFAIMYAAGYSLDNISLMALTISVGFVVDDAIVMIENIVRYIEQGDAPVRRRAKRRRPNRLYDHLDHLFADRGVHSAVLHGRHHRPIVPRICRYRIGGGGCFGGDLADADAGLVLAVFKGAGAASSGRFNQAAEGAFNWMLAAYDRGLEFVFRHQFVDAAVDLGADRHHRVSLREDPQRVFSRSRIPGSFSARSTLARIFRSQALRHWLTRIADIVRTGARVSRALFGFAGAYAYNPTENTARMFIQLKPHDERDVTSDQIIQTPAPEGRRGRRRQILHAVGSGHHDRRTSQPHPIPIHSDRYRSRRTDALGADPRSSDEEAAGVAGCRLRPAGRSAAYRDRDRPRRRLTAWNLAIADRRHAVRRVRSAPGRDDVHLDQPVQGDPRGQSAIPGRSDGAVQDLRRRAKRRADPAKLVCAFLLKARVAVGQSSRPIPGGNLVVQPGARHGARSGGRQDSGDRRPQLRVPATLEGAFQGTAQAFQASLSSMPLLVAAAILVVYIVLGRALRKLYSPDHDPIGVALGRCRRAARR